MHHNFAQHIFILADHADMFYFLFLDVYSYEEDDMVLDPYLDKHLTHFGINMRALEKVYNHFGICASL